jgi:hypothetical protein
MPRIALTALAAALLAACHCPCQDQDKSDQTAPATKPAAKSANNDRVPPVPQIVAKFDKSPAHFN